MLSFGALNAASTNDDSSFTIFHEVRKEEQEIEALALYNEALDCQKRECMRDAEEKFLAVLDTELIKQSPEFIADGKELTHEPALFLKYNVLKNLAVTCDTRGDNEKALDYYLEAAVVDESDVSLWWQIGQIALKTLNIRLARFAFEKGLIYSPNHWPCLDNLITVLYIIGDYASCLMMVSKALDRDECYKKGFAIRDQIFKEEAHFKKDCISLKPLYTVDENKEESEYQAFIEEALIIRGKRKLLAKPEEQPKVKLNKPILYYTWIHLGESLLHLYCESIDPTHNQSLCLGVDLAKYQRTPEQQAVIPLPSPDVLSKKYMRSCSKDNDKPGKRKRMLLSQDKENEPQPKRRSTRVKLSRSKETDVNWSDLLYSFLPSSCRMATSGDNDDAQDSASEFLEKPSSQAYWGSPEDIRKEAVAVSNFINDNEKNSGCIDLMGKYLMALTDHWDVKWSYGLATIFRCLYEKYRKHTCFPDFLSENNDGKYMAKIGKVILLALEFQLDYVMLSKSGRAMGSPSLSPYKSSKYVKEDMLKFLSDMHYVSMLAAANPILSQHQDLFAIRLHWVQGRYCIMKNEKIPSNNALSNCMHLISSYAAKEVILHNCQTDNVISKETIEAKMETLQQCRSLDELEDMFEKKLYNDVIKVLEPVILDTQSGKMPDVTLSVERPAQLLLLQESFLITKQYEKCLACAEIGLTESLNSFSTSDIWKPHLDKLLTCINRCLCFHEAEEYMDDYLLQQFSDKFIKIVEVIMEADDMEQVTTLPWILLYRIIKLSYVREKEKKVEGQASSVIYAHPVLCYLRNAHDYLGRKHWCCHDDGMLLQHFIDEGMEEMKNHLIAEERDLIFHDLEQCFYCLYGNPCKKSRSKLIQEHNGQPIKLTWENSKLLYKFYKPLGLPEPDLKVHTITYEVQNVLRKIVTVVPLKEVEVYPFDVLQQYIDGGDDLPDVPKDTIKEKSVGMEDLFYYLGDYYFKNKEFTKALKFYMHDVCVKPNRFQSWAAMALTRQTRLEEKINECELKSDGLIKRHIASTLRCFKNAVAINKMRCVVLEEYGQAAYMLSSYCARKLLEEDQDEKDDIPMQDNCKTMRVDMLKLSQTCFKDALKAASSKEGEKWVHYYMLGKASENLKEPLDTYLTYYQQSVEELWESGARVWKKVPYHNAPQYSIESLELLYRIHASILKVIKYTEVIDYDVLEKHLELAAKQKLYADMLEIDKAALRESEMLNTAPTVPVVLSCANGNGASDKSNGVVCSQEVSSEPAPAVLSSANDNVASDKSDGTVCLQEVSSEAVPAVLSCASGSGASDKSDGVVCSQQILSEAVSVVHSSANGNGVNDKSDAVCLQEVSSNTLPVFLSCANGDGVRDKSNRAECSQEVSSEASPAVLSSANDNEADKSDGTVCSQKLSLNAASAVLSCANGNIASDKSDGTVSQELSLEAASAVLSCTDGNIACDKADGTVSQELLLEAASAVLSFADGSGEIDQAAGRVSQEVSPETSTESGTPVNLRHLGAVTDNVPSPDLFPELNSQNTPVDSANNPDKCKNLFEILFEGGSPTVWYSDVITDKDGALYDKFDEDTDKVSDEKIVEEVMSDIVDRVCDCAVSSSRDKDEVVAMDITQCIGRSSSEDLQEENSNSVDFKVSECCSVESSSVDLRVSESCSVESSTEDLTQGEDDSEESDDECFTEEVNTKEKVSSRSLSMIYLDVSDCVEELINIVVKMCPDERPTKGTKGVRLMTKFPPLIDSAAKSKSYFESGDYVAKKKLNLLNRKPMIVRKFDDPETKKRHEAIAHKCLEAFGFCLRRFPEHFKSQYTMSHYILYSDSFKNLQWSRDLLLGSLAPTRYSIPLPPRGIYSGKKKTNLFQYIWKIPVPEIDRPGSFCTHVYKCSCILLDVLYELHDHQLLLHVSAFLHRTPDKDRKYLRDNDRAFLAIKAFDFALDILRTRCSQLKADDENASQLLLDIYEAYKHAQKMQLSIQYAEIYLIQVYQIISSKDRKDTDVKLSRQQLLDEAIKLCQQTKPVT